LTCAKDPIKSQSLFVYSNILKRHLIYLEINVIWIQWFTRMWLTKWFSKLT